LHEPDVPVIEAFDATALARKLAGPDGVATFDERVRETRTRKFETAWSAAEAASLFDIRRLERAIAESAIPVEQIDIFSRGHIVRMADLVHKSGRTVLDVAAEELRTGATLRVRDLQRADSKVMAFVRGVQEIFLAPAQINLYLTPPRRDGFPPHFDITDVFIVQIAGSKAWRIYPDYADRKPLPTADTPWEPQRHQPIGAGEELTLRTGDVLYIPRGDMHSAASLAEESMHLTISLAPMTCADMLAAALARVAKDDETFRKRVPLRRSNTCDAALAAEASALIDRLRARIDVSTIVESELKRLAAAPPAPEGMFDRALHARDGGKTE
jgi:hypothetical protein